MDNMKVRQRKTLRIPVQLIGTNERFAEWRVKCQGGCKDDRDFHTVSFDRDNDIWTCDCIGNYYGHVCIHILTVARFETKKQEKSISFWKTIEQARKQKHRIVHIKTNQRMIFGTIKI